MVDIGVINREIRRAVDTGKVVIGSREVEKNLLRGKPKIIILTNNMPKLAKENVVLKASVSEVGIYDYTGSALELGNVCGKPFSILTMAVLDEGKSKLLETLKKERESKKNN